MWLHTHTAFTTHYVKELPPATQQATGRQAPRIAGNQEDNQGDDPQPGPSNGLPLILTFTISLCKKPVELQGFEPAKHRFARATPSHHFIKSILTKTALTQLNQHILWSYGDSNPGPLPCKGSALAS